MAWFWQKRDAMNDELREEMESHVQEKAEALEAQGVSPREALAAARRSFGNQALLQDKGQEIWQHRLLNAVTTDLRFAVAQLRRSPVFTWAAILILSVGIGANTAIFTVLYQAAFQKLPVHDPDALAFVNLKGPKFNSASLRPTFPLFQALRAKQKSFEDVSGWVQDLVMVEDAQGDSHSMDATLVTGNAFSVLDVQPQAGRLLTPEDDKQEHPGLWPVVLSDSLWEEKYHRNSAVIGQKIIISGKPAQIVGVAPKGFEGITPNIAPEMFLPITFLMDHRIGSFENALRDNSFFQVDAVARLSPGVSIEQADEQLANLTRDVVQPIVQPLLAKYPRLEGVSFRASSASRGLQVLHGYESTLTVLEILMASGLLFCCVNVAGLQLARSLERAHEFAVRVALGANRNHLIRQSLTETLLIAAGGAILALPIAFAFPRVFGSFLTRPGAGKIIEVHPDWAAFAIAGGCAVLCTLVVGIVPGLFAKSANPNAVLKTKSSMKRPPSIASKVLVTAQIAVTFLLLTTAIFYWRTLHTIYGEDLGYNPAHVTEVTPQFQQMQKTSEEIVDLYKHTLHQLNAHKDIESATLTWITQLTTVDPRINVALPQSKELKQVSFNQVGPRYFQTLQTSLLAGREFTDEDRDESHCIVNALAAKQIFNTQPNETLGRRAQVSYFNEINTTCEVVGVVQSAKYADIHAPQSAILFLPITTATIQPGGFRNMVFLIRGPHEEEAQAAYRQVLTDVAPGAGYPRFLPMQLQLNDALGSERLLSSMTVFFSSVALILCGAATLTLLMMRVKQSIPEIAIRVALGATPLHAAGMVLREMVLLIVVGTAIGGFSLRGVEYVTTHYLHFGHSIAMSDVFGAICLLAGMTLSAGGIPALRAATLQPMQVLCRDS